jgi:hypothetical protein
MIKTSTQNELVQYIYNELADNATVLLEKAFTHDDELVEGCSELLLIQSLMDASYKSPSERSINNILNYSKSLSLQS